MDVFATSLSFYMPSKLSWFIKVSFFVFNEDHMNGQYFNKDHIRTFLLEVEVSVSISTKTI